AFESSAEPHTTVAASPDGVLIAVGDRHSGGAAIWHAETGERLQALRGHNGTVSAVALSRDNRLLATGGRDGVVKLWDVASGLERPPFARASQAVTSLAFSPDGLSLAVAKGDNQSIESAGEVTVWDVETGRVLQTLRGHRGGVSDLAYSPDGRKIATSSWDR